MGTRLAVITMVGSLAVVAACGAEDAPTASTTSAPTSTAPASTTSASTTTVSVPEPVAFLPGDLDLSAVRVYEAAEGHVMVGVDGDPTATLLTWSEDHDARTALDRQLRGRDVLDRPAVGIGPAALVVEPQGQVAFSLWWAHDDRHLLHLARTGATADELVAAARAVRPSTPEEWESVVDSVSPVSVPQRLAGP